MTIRDNQVDQEWLECVLEDLWDLVKKVRRRSGPKRQAYVLQFGATVVDVTVTRRTLPAVPATKSEEEKTK